MSVKCCLGVFFPCLARPFFALIKGGTTAAAERTRTAVGVERLATPSVMLTLHRGINDILAEVAYAGLKSAIQAVWKHCCSVWCSETPFAVAGHAVAFNYHASNPDQKKLLYAFALVPLLRRRCLFFSLSVSRQLLEKERENSSAFKISADKTMTVPDLQHIAPRTVARFRHTVAQAHENLLHIALEPLKRSLKVTFLLLCHRLSPQIVSPWLLFSVALCSTSNMDGNL